MTNGLWLGILLLAADPAGTPAPSQVGEFEATVVAVERVGKTWTQDAFTTLKAKKGDEIILVRVSLRTRAAEAKLEGFTLRSAAGQEYKSVTLEYSLHGGQVTQASDTPENFELILPFGVPIDTQPTTLLIGGVAFDLRAVPVTKSEKK